MSGFAGGPLRRETEPQLRAPGPRRSAACFCGRFRRASRGPGCDGGQRRRRHAPRFRESQRARRTTAGSRTSRRRIRRGSHRAISKRCGRGCWPAAPSTRTTVKKAERVVMLSAPLARMLFPARIHRAADRPRPRCRRTAKLYGDRRSPHRPGVHPDGQPAPAAVPSHRRRSRPSRCWCWRVETRPIRRCAARSTTPSRPACGWPRHARRRRNSCCVS